MTPGRFLSTNLDKLVEAAELPALSGAAMSIVELSRDPASGPAEFAAAIECDPGLVSQMLALVNSSYYGLAQKVASVQFAVALLGIRAVRNFVLWNAVFDLLPNPKCGPFHLSTLWQDSLRRGLFARAVAPSLGGQDAETCFTAALLQDMAIPLLADIAPDAYEDLLLERAQSSRRLSDLEREAFGWSHADVGAAMARRWSFPDALATLVERHGSTESPPTESGQPDDGLAVALSAFLPSVADAAWSEVGRFQSLFQAVRDRGAAGLTELLELIDKEYEELAPSLRMPIPNESLAAVFREASNGA